MHYPSLLNFPFISREPIHWQEDFSHITPTETAFIDEQTKPNERVLIVAFVDWAYLAQAHRAPKSFFVPLIVSFDDTFVQRTFKDADTVFVDNIVNKYLEFPRMPGIMNLISRDFVPIETRGNLTLYRRRTKADVQ